MGDRDGLDGREERRRMGITDEGDGVGALLRGVHAVARGGARQVAEAAVMPGPLVVGPGVDQRGPDRCGEGE